MTSTSPQEIRTWSPEMGMVPMWFSAGATESEVLIEQQLTAALEAGDLTTSIERFSKLQILFVLRTLVPMIAMIGDENVRLMANEGVLLAYALAKKEDHQELREYLRVDSVEDLKAEVEDLLRTSARIESFDPTPEVPYNT